MTATKPSQAESGSTRLRRTFTPDQKLACVREHLLGGTPISDVCQTHTITPAMFYQWQRQLFDNGAAAFGEKRPRPQVPAQDASKMARLEAKLQQKDSVIGDIMIELMAVKKSIGEI